MKNKVNEWQELSLKKDIEKIRKSIIKNQEVHHAIIFDLLIAVIAILIDKFLLPSNEASKTWIFWILLTICLIPFLVILVKNIYTFAKKRQKRYETYSIPELIESFDNDICYYVMMADSYNQMLIDLIAQASNNTSNLASFYYIESWYYINKAKNKLCSMLFKTKYIFSKETSVVLKKNLISLNRLVNITLIMEDIRKSSNLLIQNKALILSDKTSVDLNALYDKFYKEFVNEINQNFDNVLNINFEEKNRFEY